MGTDTIWRLGVGGALAGQAQVLPADVIGCPTVSVNSSSRSSGSGTSVARTLPKRQRAYTDQLPDAFQRLADLQAHATAISHYGFGLVPGPLQSPDYVRAVIRIGSGVWWESSADEVETRVAFRLEQKRRVLEAEPPKKLRFVFTEDALHHVVGGPSVMQGQVIHLLQLIESKPNLSIQIVPADARDNPALGGGIVVLDFAAAPRICVTPALYGPYTYHDQSVDTIPLTRAFQRVQGLALSAEDSRALLIRNLKES